MLVAIVVVAGLVLLLDWACKLLPICGVSCRQLARWGTAAAGLATCIDFTCIDCQLHTCNQECHMVAGGRCTPLYPSTRAIDDAVLIEWLP